MTLGHELFRNDWILHARADLVTDKLGEIFVGIWVSHNVMEVPQPLLKARFRP